MSDPKSPESTSEPAPESAALTPAAPPRFQKWKLPKFPKLPRLPKLPPKLKKILIFGSLGILGLLILLALIFRETTYYLYQSVQGQATLLFQGRSVEEMLNDPDVPIQVKNQFRLVKDVKEFAEKELGLKPTRNYEKYLDLQRDYLVMVLTASPPLKLESYTWWFPIVGTVPYKGYYDKAEGLRVEKELQAQGYETNFRPSPAYSTLGWFQDPLLNTMLQYGETYLVNTVIHESTHATLFISGEIPFNENMASFVGDMGTLAYYAHKYGPGSTQYKNAANQMQDQKTFARFINQAAERFDKLYKSDLFEANKVKQKAELIETLKAEFKAKTAPKMHSSGYKAFADKPWNNALIMSYRHYNQDLEKFEYLYRKTGKNIPRLMQFLQKQGPDLVKKFRDAKLKE